MTIDVGTGDGRAVLALAAREPMALLIGLDANAASMAESSRRAARAARNGALGNALFVVASAADLPAELRGIASLVTVRFPWGSLLRGCLGADTWVAAGLVSLIARGGSLELLLAPAHRDNLLGVPAEPDEVVAVATATFGGAGLVLLEAREATTGEVLASGSSWARRLLGRTGRTGWACRASAERRPVLIRFRSP